MTNFTANEIEKEITSLLPTEKDRKLYLSLFLEALKKANSYGNNKWSAYCDKKQKVIYWSSVKVINVILAIDFI
jgi:hypothetical protein